MIFNVPISFVHFNLLLYVAYADNTIFDSEIQQFFVGKFHADTSFHLRFISRTVLSTVLTDMLNLYETSFCVLPRHNILKICSSSYVKFALVRIPSIYGLVSLLNFISHFSFLFFRKNNFIIFIPIRYSMVFARKIIHASFSAFATYLPVSIKFFTAVIAKPV